VRPFQISHLPHFYSSSTSNPQGQLDDPSGQHAKLTDHTTTGLKQVHTALHRMTAKTRAMFRQDLTKMASDTCQESKVVRSPVSDECRNIEESLFTIILSPALFFSCFLTFLPFHFSSLIFFHARVEL
jgi:hypothetical protein